MRPSAEALAERARWLREQLDGLPSLSSPSTAAGADWIAARTRRVQALDAFLARLRRLPDAPRVSEGFPSARVRMLGIASTSTMGVEGALRNWLTRAEALPCTPLR